MRLNLSSKLYKSRFLILWNETFMNGENSTKYWPTVSTTDKFAVFTKNFERRNSYVQCRDLYSGI